VLATAEALRTGDRDVLAEAFAVSHQSLRADYGVSTEALDVLVEGLTRSGAIGARLTGGGFGGCVVALADAATADEVAAGGVEVARAAGFAAYAIPCASADGASVLTLP
jgi:galactokinase